MTNTTPASSPTKISQAAKFTPRVISSIFVLRRTPQNCVVVSRTISHDRALPVFSGHRHDHVETGERLNRLEMTGAIGTIRTIIWKPSFEEKKYYANEWMGIRSDSIFIMGPQLTVKKE